MSKTTENLGLFKYDPSTDGAQTFNIEKALNENWDKLDAAVLLALAAAAPYSAKTYALGAYCTKGGRLYRCTTAITAAETWTAGHWTETTVTAELIAHATSKSNPHGVTAAQTGAYTKGETDTLLANKVPFGYGWGEANAVNAPYNDPDYITKTCIFVAASGNIPADGIWIGFAYFSDNSANGNMLLTALTGPVGSMYTRYKTNGNEWSAWKQITTETELDTKVSKSGDTMTGLLNVNDGIYLRGGRLMHYDGTSGLYLSNYSTSGKEATFEINAEHGYVNLAVTNSQGTGVDYYRILHKGNAQSLGFPKIAIGSYVGTGTYSSANANSLTFDFVPKLVIIVADARTNFPGTVFINGQSQSESIGHNYISNYQFTVGWSGNTVTWYSTNSNYGAEAQLNKSGVTYRYIALG